MMTTTMMMGLEQAIPTGIALLAAKTFAWLSLTVVAAAVMRRAPAAVRSWVWTLGLSGMLFLPALSLGLPEWGVLPQLQEEGGPFLIETAAADLLLQPISQASEGSAAELRSEPVAELVAAVPSAAVVNGPGVVEAPELKSLLDASVASTLGATNEGSELGSKTALPAISTLLLAIWLAGAFSIAVPLIRAGLHAARLRFTGSFAIEPTTLEVLRRAKVSLGITRRVRLGVSDTLRVPVTFGERPPTILLPAEAENWPMSRLRNVLLHELAHIRRHDWATQWLGAAVRCVYWMNPLVWVAHRRQRMEAELACDDVVLSVGSRPSAYAGDLVAVARTLRHHRKPAMGLVAMARSSDLSHRVDAILDAGRSRGWRAVRWVAGGGLSALLVAIPIASAAPADRIDELADGTMHVSENPAGGSAPFGVATIDALAFPEPAPAIRAPNPGAFGLEPIPSRRTTLIETNPSVAVAQEAACIYEGEGRHSTSVNGDDRQYRITWETDYCSVRVEMEGDIRFSADDRSIESMSRGAQFEMEVRIGRARRLVIAEPDGGRIEYRYWVDRDARPWDAEAQAWFASVLPELFRHTTFNAEERVERILRDGGPNAVFTEVERIHSDHVARLYLDLLMAKADLSTRELGHVLEVAGDRLESDHQLAELLIAFAEHEGLPEPLRRPYLDAAATLESDYQMGRVLGRLLDEQALSNDVLLDVLAAVDQIESDHQASEVLMRVPANYTLTASQRAAFLRASHNIESDHSHGKVLNAFLDQGELSPEELADVLDATTNLGSDHQRSEVLQRIAREYTLTGPALTSFLESASAMESDHQLQMTAMAALARRDLDPEQLALVFEIAARIESDHSATEVLLALIDLDGDLPTREWNRLIEMMGGIGSDHNRGQIINTLIESGDLGEGQLVDVLELLEETRSEHQVADALVLLARTQTLGSDAQEAFMRVAEDLRSERQRDRAVAALARNRRK